jgi:uncharacterized protein with NRDE domain
MCIIAWNWQPNSDQPLLLIANRDEYYDRPALPLHWWNGGSMLAGKDLKGSGTWLGVNRAAKLGAITNYRSVHDARPDAPSRGALVFNFLNQRISARAYLENLKSVCTPYNPFNLLLFDGSELLGFESRNRHIVALNAGVGVVSNADFVSNWPKSQNLKTEFEKIISNKLKNNENYFSILKNENKPIISDLPNTGLPIDMEHALSSIFIKTPIYGTRNSSIFDINKNTVSCTERSFNSNGILYEINHTYHQRESGSSILTSRTSRLS